MTHDYPLYVDEPTVAKMVGVTENYWLGMVSNLEDIGLPRVDPLMNGRYWPAVKQFFANRHWKSA